MALGGDAVGRYYQPYLQDINFSTQKIAYVYSASMLLGIIMLICEKFFYRAVGKNDLSVLIASQLLISASIFLIVILNSSIAYYIIVLFFGLNYILEPSLQNYLNQNIPSSIRATVLSFYELVGAFGEMASGLLIGYLTYRLGILAGFISAAVSIFISALLIARLKKKCVILPS